MLPAVVVPVTAASAQTAPLPRTASTGRRSARAASYRRPISKRRTVLGAFAMLACTGIALVTVTDPYAGATASPYYETAASVPSGTVQKFAIQGGYVLVSATSDKVSLHVDTPVQAASTASDGSTAVMGYTTPSGTAQAYAAELVAQRGWGASQFSCLVDLWNRESGWNTHAANSSGAYGIPQSLPGSKMSSAGSDWANSYQTQIKWGLGYIAGSYGSPCGAWASSQSRGWY